MNLYQATFENNNTSELSIAGTGFSASSSFAHSGSFSLKAVGPGETSEYRAGLTSWKLFISFWFYIEHVSNPGSTEGGFPLIVRNAADGLIMHLALSHLTDGTRSMTITNDVAGSTSSPAATISVATWHLLEVKLVVAGADSVCDWYLDSFENPFRQVPPLNSNLGTTPIAKVRPGQMTNVGFSNFYFDEPYINDRMFRSQMGDRTVPVSNTRPRPFAPGLAR